MTAQSPAGFASPPASTSSDSVSTDMTATPGVALPQPLRTCAAAAHEDNGTDPTLSIRNDFDTTDRTLPVRLWRRRVTPWSSIMAHEYKGSGTDEDPFVVVWLPGDVEDPYNYNPVYKWTLTLIAAWGTLCTSMGSSALSGAVGSLHKEFPGESDTAYIMVTSAYVLGFVIGPLLWAPFSEVFGRRAVYVWTLIPFTIFLGVSCGVQTMGALLAMRFLAGMFGCSAMTTAAGYIADMFEGRDRGLAMGVFGLMPWLGPALGPIVGGFLNPFSWRWAAAVVAIFTAVITALHVLFLPETYAIVLLRNRASALSKATGRLYLSADEVSHRQPLRKIVIDQLRVPYILMFTEPIVFILSLYLAVVFAILYMQFTSFPVVFQMERHWSPGVASLPFLGISTGCNVGLIYMVFWGNPKYAKKLQKEGYLSPEERLPPALAGAILLPTGLMIFAWTCAPTRIHWIVCVLATVPYGAGLVLIFLSILNYLVDAYLPTAASVIAGGTVLRSLLGGFFPLFTLKMYHNLGTNWASALCAFIALVFSPAPYLLIKYGPTVRRWTKHGREADDFVKSMSARMHAENDESAESEARDEVEFEDRGDLEKGGGQYVEEAKVDGDDMEKVRSRVRQSDDRTLEA